MQAPQPFINGHIYPDIQGIRAGGNLHGIAISRAQEISNRENSREWLAVCSSVSVLQFQRHWVGHINRLGAASVTWIPCSVDQVGRLTASRQNGNTLKHNRATGNNLMRLVWIPAPRNSDRQWLTGIARAVAVTVSLVSVGY